MKESFKEALIGNKEQRKKNRIFYYELLLIVGAIFFGQGILAMFPQDLEVARVLGGFGFLLIIIVVTSYKIDNRRK